jgi:hypothetical protein
MTPTEQAYVRMLESNLFDARMNSLILGLILACIVLHWLTTKVQRGGYQPKGGIGDERPPTPTTGSGVRPPNMGSGGRRD